jgi:hypothetical protein
MSESSQQGVTVDPVYLGYKNQEQAQLAQSLAQSLTQWQLMPTCGQGTRRTMHALMQQHTARSAAELALGGIEMIDPGLGRTVAPA